MSEPKDQSTIIIFFRISPKEELMYNSIKKYMSFKLKVKFIYDLLAILLYTAEILFYLYGSYENVSNFKNKPKYVIIQALNNENEYSTTVAAINSGKYCGHYDNPLYVVNFANNFDESYYRWYYVYLVFYVSSSVIDGYKRFKARCKKYKKYKDYSQPQT